MSDVLNDLTCGESASRRSSTPGGIRNASDIFLDNAAKFYDETFFDYFSNGRMLTGRF